MFRYLGLFFKQEDAAAAYDKEAVQQRGAAALTNFPMDNYVDLISAEDMERYRCALTRYLVIKALPLHLPRRLGMVRR